MLLGREPSFFSTLSLFAPDWRGKIGPEISNLSVNMQRRLILLFIFGLLFLVPVARAQGPLSLAELEIDLWPEYDRSEVLVIYKAKLPANVSLPVDITFKIPAVAGEPFAVAVRQMDGALLNATYDRQIEGEWALITITATMPEIQLEYYDPQIQKDGNNRSYTYVWPGDYAVDAMRIVVQEPIGASQVSIEPDLGSFVQYQNDPMRYYLMDVGAPKANESVSVAISYFKDTDILSIESLQVQPSAPIDGNDGSGQSGFITYLPWIIGGLGVLLLAGGVLWYLRMNAEQVSPTPKRKRRTKTAIKSPEQVSAANGNDGAFCHQCGKRSASGDRFCRSCGAKLRSS
jgi:hypothetical protein